MNETRNGTTPDRGYPVDHRDTVGGIGALFSGVTD